MITAIISFRIEKWLKSWTDYAGKGFQKGELLRLILTKAAIDASNESGLVRVAKGLLDRNKADDVGNTVVMAVRLPLEIVDLIKDCASKRGKTTSEWCAGALAEWQAHFLDFYKEQKEKPDLPKFAENYRRFVAENIAVYAQKSQKQPSGITS